MNNKKFIILVLLLPIMLMSCRGWKTPKPPVHPNPNLDWQAKYTAQAYTGNIPEGTVAWGREAVYENNESRNDYNPIETIKSTGKSEGYYTKKNPLKLSKEFLIRGQDQYNVYCSMCHGQNGAGNGTVVQKGYYIASNLHDIRYDSNRYPDGKLFDVISNGYNNMWGYKKQISEDDRWAIVAYIRALQLSKSVPYKSLNATDKKQLDSGR